MLLELQSELQAGDEPEQPHVTSDRNQKVLEVESSILWCVQLETVSQRALWGVAQALAAPRVQLKGRLLRELRLSRGEEEPPIRLAPTNPTTPA